MLLLLSVALAARALIAQQQQGADSPPAPRWITVHGEYRIRYETTDRRYRPGEQGGDQQLDHRTRLQVGLQKASLYFYSEFQDSRVNLTDSGSTANFQHIGKTRVLQLHGGWRTAGLWGTGWRVNLEAGRFTRDLGSRRFLARNLFRNTTNAFDGVAGSVGKATWSLQAFAFHPLQYTTDGEHLDRRFRSARFYGAHYTNSARPRRQFNIYAFHLNDGKDAAEPRRLFTNGARWFMNAPASGRDYEVESAWQAGSLGALDQRAWFYHARAGYTWAHAWRPRWSAMHDYASAAFDPLYGARRFEFGPTNMWGLFARANVNSPAHQFILNPLRPLEVNLMHRWLWLADNTQEWRPVGWQDPTGQAGSYLGQQIEVRVRYRWRKNFELDTGFVRFWEGGFVRRFRPVGPHAANYFFVGTDWRL